MIYYVTIHIIAYEIQCMYGMITVNEQAEIEAELKDL